MGAFENPLMLFIHPKKSSKAAPPTAFEEFFLTGPGREKPPGSAFNKRYLVTVNVVKPLPEVYPLLLAVDAAV
jgi:hypothetical protein